MRGLQESKGTNRIYVGVANGKFVQRVEKDTQGAIARVLGEKSPHAGTTVYEKKYESFTGLLKDIEIKEHAKYGKSFNFVFDVSVDYPEELHLNIDYSSGYASDILKRLPNINTGFDVTLRAYDFVGDGLDGKPKNFKGISISQGDVKVAPYFTKENPNGLPQMVKIKVKGVETWDNTEMIEFLEKNVLVPFLAKIKEAETETTPEKFDGDNLPF